MVSNPFKSSVQTGTQAGAQAQFKARRNKLLVLWLLGFGVAVLIGLGILAVTQFSVTGLVGNLLPNRAANRAEVSVDTVTQPNGVQPAEVEAITAVNEEDSKKDSEKSRENNEADSVVDNEQNSEPVSEVLPAELKLDIPFTSQAPHANWNLPYQEACEEASVLMAARYLLGRTIDGPDDADTAILELVNFNTDQLGQPIDTTAAETARIIEEFYELDTEVIYDFSWEDVKHALVAGYPVIMPAAGQQLGNPNFTEPGPRYHMLIIKGYTADHVITNDPGTRNGKDYLYNYDTLYTAAHDWNDGAVESGQKVIIIVKPSVSPAEQ